MAMRPCDNCLENNWKFNKLDSGWINAECQMCGHNVEWEPKQKIKVRHEGDKCRKCGKPVKAVPLRITEKKRRKPYYYSHWLKCSCGQTYISEDYRVDTKNRVPLPDTIRKNKDGTLTYVGTN